MFTWLREVLCCFGLHTDTKYIGWKYPHKHIDLHECACGKVLEYNTAR